MASLVLEMPYSSLKLIQVKNMEKTKRQRVPKFSSEKEKRVANFCNIAVDRVEVSKNKGSYAARVWGGGGMQ